MDLTLLVITGIPLFTIFTFLCEEMTSDDKKIFGILSVVLLVLMAIVGVALDVNVYIGT